MPRAAVPALCAALALVLVLATPRAARADEPTQDYVVQPGDSCISIAVKFLGDARALRELHRLNPQLGPDTPHVLVPGQVLTLPRTDGGPDARLTSKSGDVRVRPAAATAWDNARRGMELFRAWRVGAEARASAEVTYTDDQHRLQLREHTVVIIYGPERRRARSGAEVVIERGALRSRLGELSGKPVAPLRVQTPSATAALGAGSAVLAVADDGLSTVANHDGAAIDLRGKAGGRVAVQPGMGTRVAKGKRPEPPRRLPAAPAWIAGDPAGFVAIDGAALVSAAWQPVAGAAAYRFELAHGNALVAAAELPATITRFELHGAPPGDYVATVATLDADRLEGKPGPARALAVRGVAIVAPGADAPALATPLGEDAPIAATPAPLHRAAAGARVIADGLQCAAGGAPAAVAILATTGAITLRCTGAGGEAFAPLPLEVAAVEIAVATGAGTVTQGRTIRVSIALRSAAPLGDAWQLEPSPGLTVEDVTRTADGLVASVTADDDAPAAGSLRVVNATTQRTAGTVAIAIVPGPRPAPGAPPAPAAPTAPDDGRRPPQTITVGVFAGWLHLPTGAEAHALGDPPSPDYVADGGATLGLRAAYWWSDASPLYRGFAELEVAAAPTRFTGADELAWIYDAHLHLGIRAFEHAGFSAHALAGVGLYALRADAPVVTDDVDPSVDGGLTFVYQLDPAIRVRLDGRAGVLPRLADDGGTGTFLFELNAGVEVVAY